RLPNRAARVPASFAAGFALSSTAGEQTSRLEGNNPFSPRRSSALLRSSASMTPLTAAPLPWIAWYRKAFMSACSADFQSAVSPISNRQGHDLPHGPNHSQAPLPQVDE